MENNNCGENEERENQKGTKRSIDEVEDCTTSPTERKKDLKLDSAIIAETSIGTVQPAKCSNEINETAMSKDGESKIDYRRKKKCVLLISYCGSGYSGMQR